MAFVDQLALSRDENFIGRVQVAIVKAAIAIQNGDPGVGNHAGRAALAYAVLLNPEHYARLMAAGVANNPVVTAGSTDADIELTVNSLWNAYTGPQG